MSNYTVKLENCYGIRNLEQEFDFQDGKPYSIYAPNGFMKTSFSKAFLDLQNGVESKDLVFPERKTVRIVTDGGQNLKGENVFVIEPYKENFSSEGSSLILVNRDLKLRYEEAVKSVEEKLKAVENKLKQLSGLTGKKDTPVTEICSVFGIRRDATTLSPMP